MTCITFDSKKHSFNKETNTFTISGKTVKFDTEYEIVNPKTKRSIIFGFDYSTGSEWDPNTIWIYKSEAGVILNLLNDDVTPQHEIDYLNAKTRFN